MALDTSNADEDDSEQGFTSPSVPTPPQSAPLGRSLNPSSLTLGGPMNTQLPTPRHASGTPFKSDSNPFAGKVSMSLPAGVPHPEAFGAIPEESSAANISPSITPAAGSRYQQSPHSKALGETPEQAQWIDHQEALRGGRMNALGVYSGGEWHQKTAEYARVKLAQELPDHLKGNGEIPGSTPEEKAEIYANQQLALRGGRAPRGAFSEGEWQGKTPEYAKAVLQDQYLKNPSTLSTQTPGQPPNPAQPNLNPSSPTNQSSGLQSSGLSPNNANWNQTTPRPADPRLVRLKSNDGTGQVLDDGIRKPQQGVTQSATGLGFEDTSSAQHLQNIQQHYGTKDRVGDLAMPTKVTYASNSSGRPGATIDENGDRTQDFKNVSLNPASVTYKPAGTPGAPTGRISDETGDRTNEFMNPSSIPSGQPLQTAQAQPSTPFDSYTSPLNPATKS